MKAKSILVTSDDGYNSIGVRILIAVLKKDFSLSISGTKDQQSGVGGKLSLAYGGRWGTDQVDGIDSLWVDGTPIDAIDAAQAFFAKKFDLVISGLNWGANLGTALITSGTYAAAFRSLGINLTKKAIALSWDMADKIIDWFYRDQANKPIPQKYFNYPGKAIKKIVDLAIKEGFWGSDLLNINLPRNRSNKLKFTKPIEDLTRYFKFPMILDARTHRFHYPDGLSTRPETDDDFDGPALKKGFITISACQSMMLDEEVYKTLKGLTLKI